MLSPRWFFWRRPCRSGLWDGKEDKQGEQVYRLKFWWQRELFSFSNRIVFPFLVVSCFSKTPCFKWMSVWLSRDDLPTGHRYCLCSTLWGARLEPRSYLFPLKIWPHVLNHPLITTLKLSLWPGQNTAYFCNNKCWTRMDLDYSACFCMSTT